MSFVPAEFYRGGRHWDPIIQKRREEIYASRIGGDLIGMEWEPAKPALRAECAVMGHCRGYTGEGSCVWCGAEPF